MARKPIRVEKSSGNIFLDIGFDEAAELLAKAKAEPRAPARHPRPQPHAKAGRYAPRNRSAKALQGPVRPHVQHLDGPADTLAERPGPLGRDQDQARPRPGDHCRHRY